MTTEEGTEVLFKVYVTQAEDLFGVVLYIDDQTDSDVVPCFRSVFRNLSGGTVTTDGVTALFADCHKDALDAIGLLGVMTQSEYEAKLHKSVEMSADMMAKYGLTVLDLGSVDNGVLLELFADEWPDLEDEEDEAEEPKGPKHSLN